MPFFTRPTASFKKNKVVHPKRKHFNGEEPRKKKTKPNYDDEEITSDEDDELLRKKFNSKVNEVEEEEEDEETAQEKKVRLAQKYLKEIQEQNAKEDDEDDEGDREAVGQFLKEQMLEASGRLQKTLADSYEGPILEDIKVLKSKHQKLPITSTAISNDYIYSASKDCSIVKYSIKGERLGAILRSPIDKQSKSNTAGHSTHVYALALSSDGKYLASGDKTGLINIWNGDTLEHIKQFKKHRSCISGLVFRHGTNTLYSSSHDRCVMVWNIDVMAFVEHLGGHAAAITGIDALMRESCITSGGRDESIIVNVIVEDKQLIYSGRQGSIDGVKLINEKTFLSFGQDGSLALWSTLKKSPHCIVKAAHGFEENGAPRWITAVAAFVNTDIVASGSSDGFLRLWKVDMSGKKTLTELFNVPVIGFINSINFTTSGSHVIVGVGQEHKLGRWFKDKDAKNSIVIIPLKRKC